MPANDAPILAEPDRPGTWLWRESAADEWREVIVGLLSGGGHLHCWFPRMADFDGPVWRGQWKLLVQAGPPGSRVARPFES